MTIPSRPSVDSPDGGAGPSSLERSQGRPHNANWEPAQRFVRHRLGFQEPRWVFRVRCPDCGWQQIHETTASAGQAVASHNRRRS